MKYTVLVPLDGSPESTSVLPALEPLGRSGGLRAIFLEAISHPGGESVAVQNLRKATEPSSAWGIESIFVARHGSPADLILDVSASEGADLIAMSTHGRTGLRRLLMGSVTESVLRHSTLPLLVARPETPPRPWSRIVVGLDGSDTSEHILPFAAALARRAGASLDLVTASLPVEAQPLHPDGFPASYYPKGDPLPYLETIRGRLATENIPAEVHSLIDFPARGIVEHARSRNAGLICMGTHGRGGLSRLLMGSVAEGVLRHAPCPVFVVRSAGRPTPSS